MWNTTLVFCLFFQQPEDSSYQEAAMSLKVIIYDVDQVVHEGLMEMAGERPGAQLAPGEIGRAHV